MAFVSKVNTTYLSPVLRVRAGLPVSDGAIASGLSPSPDHDLINHGGKTISDLTFTNFYVGVWNDLDISSIDLALAAAMTDTHLNNVIAQYFPGKNITTIFRNSQVLQDSNPGTFSKNDIENLVKTVYSQGKMNSTIFAVRFLTSCFQAGQY